MAISEKGRDVRARAEQDYGKSGRSRNGFREGEALSRRREEGAGKTGAGGGAGRSGDASHGRAGSKAGQPGKGRKRKGKRGFVGAFLRLVLVLALVGAVAAAVLTYKMRDVFTLQRVNSVDLEQQVRGSIPPQVVNDERLAGYKNIALFGVDSRTGDLLGGDNRSDSIMICSIREETGEIRLVSIYRDTMLEVQEDPADPSGTSFSSVYSKANLAYALGGPAQAVRMLNRNLDLNIVDFVTVGFEGLAHTIDALGGIEIEIDEEERGYLNMYLHDMHVELGTDETPVEETGLVTVTGIQATAYSRIRYTSGDDFRRAERQREVLQKTLARAREAGPVALVEVANNVVGDMATSLSTSELLGLITRAGDLELVGTGGFPREDLRKFGNTYEDGDYVLPVTLADNVAWLHAFLFGEEGYTPSDEAAARSNWISAHY